MASLSLAASLRMAPFIALLLLLVSFTGSAIVSDIDYFNHFVQKYGKDYKVGTNEYNQRFRSFQHTLARIKSMSHDSNLNDAFYGITEFADMTAAEFSELLLRSGSSTPTGNSGTQKRQLYAAPLSQPRELPLRVDWREKGIISQVRNQGKCGACWAYSTIETIESMSALSMRAAVWRLSVQQVIDCASSSSSPNRGCDGGDTCAALSWMQKSGVKLVREEEYPMRDDSSHCRITPSQGVQVANFTCEDLTGNEEKILWKLAYEGPVTAAVDATSWQDYLGGIIQFHCESDRNHAVQIVGYDMTGDTGFYIVKNTWGRDFGMDGYLHIAVGKNLCGIASEVSSVEVLV